MIGQIFIYGNSLQNNVVAIVSPDPDWAKQWAIANGCEGDLAVLCQKPEMKADILKDMLRLATENKLSSLEKPKEFCLHPEQFTIENGGLTSTFKMKRNVALELRKELID